MKIAFHIGNRLRDLKHFDYLSINHWYMKNTKDNYFTFRIIIVNIAFLLFIDWRNK